MRPLYQLLLGRVGIYEQGQKLVQFLSPSLSLSLVFFHILSSESMMLFYDKVSMCFVVKTKKLRNTSWHHSITSALELFSKTGIKLK